MAPTVSERGPWKCLVFALVCNDGRMRADILPLAVESRLDNSELKESYPRLESDTAGKGSVPCGRATPSTKNPCRVIDGNLSALLPSSMGDLFEFGGD